MHRIIGLHDNMNYLNVGKLSGVKGIDIKAGYIALISGDRRGFSLGERLRLSKMVVQFLCAAGLEFMLL